MYINMLSMQRRSSRVWLSGNFLGLHLVRGRRARKDTSERVTSAALILADRDKVQIPQRLEKGMKIDDVRVKGNED